MTVPVITVLTPNPSPHQVHLLNAVSAEPTIQLRVIYVARFNPVRKWNYPTPEHEHTVLADGAESQSVARSWCQDSELFVAASYSDPISRELIRTRAASGKPWCFWGERPGFSRFKLLGKLRRWWHLAPLRKSNAPIWGMSQFGIDGWKAEFGEHRRYFNMPYYTDLERLRRPIEKLPSKSNTTRFLYLGSLIPRKGADLVGTAFSTLARENPDVSVDFVGSGPLEQSLQEQLASFGERVRFHGFCDETKLPEIVHAADVLVAPSRHDGWGMMVPEALTAGLPVISTDRTGSAVDYVRSGENGWLIPANDWAALTKSMRDAANTSGEVWSKLQAGAVESMVEYRPEYGAKRFRAIVTETLKG